MQNNNIPRHVAIIPDGNRRWAKRHGEQPWIGHERGAMRIEELARASRDAGVQHLSLWGSSLENLTKRPLRERRALLEIYDTYFTRLFSKGDLEKYDVRVNVIGRWKEQLPETLCKKIDAGMKQTKEHRTSFLNFFIAYSGDDEMVHAVNTIVATHPKGEQVTKEHIKEALMTKDLPPVDYMIRTGGEPHLSTGFMMWDTANAQLYFTQKLFPDFGQQAFMEALEEYQRRARRLGA